MKQQNVKGNIKIAIHCYGNLSIIASCDVALVLCKLNAASEQHYNEFVVILIYYLFIFYFIHIFFYIYDFIFKILISY